MTKHIDRMLAQLRAQPLDRDLSRLESAVWSRIDQGRGNDVFGGRALFVQLAVTCGALLLGVLVAQLAGISVMPMPPSSEIVVLSDDSQVAPSVLLEGGL